MKINFDPLSKYLIIAGAIFLLDRHFRIFGLIVIGYSIWRALSKNQYKRQQELIAFRHSLQMFKNKFNYFTTKIKNKREYKIFPCPNCNQKLRVPRKVGKITITCSKCGNNFKAKS